MCVCSKIDCKEQNGGYSIKPDLGATTPGSGGWGAPVRPSACTPDMASRYTPDQAARDRAWMNTCSSLTAAAQVGQPTVDTFIVCLRRTWFVRGPLIQDTAYRLIQVTAYRLIQVMAYQLIQVTAYQLIQVTAYQLIQVTAYRLIQVTAYQLIKVTAYRLI